MARRTLARPTDTELEILKALWDRGPSTVREIHEALAETKGTGYTTVLKQLQIMASKGLVERDEVQRAHVYRATDERAETERQLVSDLIERAFDGSASKLVLHAIESRSASTEELDEIRRLLEAHEAKEKAR